ncbi:MAG: CHAT domain-containing protein, partial [Candidatus Hodarchaeota archaeon]
MFAPLKKSIKNKNVYIINHQFLHFIPFEVLYDGRQFLVNQYSFSYIPSASILQFLDSSQKKYDSILIFGNPKIDYIDNYISLKYAEEEAIMIAKIFSSKNIYLKNSATETIFREQSKYHDICHIASHGLFDATNPLNSMLLLSKDNKNDGIITAKELYEIQINSPLIILSSCETAKAEIGNGDELIGLIRGFFFAGTSSVLASLWKVDDIATKELMVLFYKYLKYGKKTIIQALQQAKIDMINSKDYNHPFFWGPFVLYGIGY